MSAEEELTRKTRVCAAHRAGATRLINQARDLLGSELDADELTLLQTNLSSKSKTLEALNAQIVELTPDDQLEDEIGQADEYSENILRSLLKVSKALKGLSHVEHPVGADRCDSGAEVTPESGHGEGDTVHREPAEHHEDSTHGRTDSTSHRLDAGHEGAMASSKVKLPKISLREIQYTGLPFGTHMSQQYTSTAPYPT